MFFFPRPPSLVLNTGANIFFFRLSVALTRRRHGSPPSHRDSDERAYPVCRAHHSFFSLRLLSLNGAMGHLHSGRFLPGPSKHLSQLSESKRDSFFFRLFSYLFCPLPLFLSRTCFSPVSLSAQVLSRKSFGYTQATSLPFIFSEESLRPHRLSFLRPPFEIFLCAGARSPRLPQCGTVNSVSRWIEFPAQHDFSRTTFSLNKFTAPF